MKSNDNGQGFIRENKEERKFQKHTESAFFMAEWSWIVNKRCGIWIVRTRDANGADHAVWVDGLKSQIAEDRKKGYSA